MNQRRMKEMKRMVFNRFSYRLVFKPDRERDGKGVSEETTGGWVVRISFHFVQFGDANVAQ
jgi:hypothetical protein